MAPPAETFAFLDPGSPTDGVLELVLAEAHPEDPDLGRVPDYEFKMRLAGQTGEVGRIVLRVGNTEHIIRYAGHVGYQVIPEYRGHRYASRACRLLLPFARTLGLETLWITCGPENTASRRTCELAGARFVDIVDLPEDSDMYLRGERQKCRYRLEVPECAERPMYGAGLQP